MEFTKEQIEEMEALDFTGRYRFPSLKRRSEMGKKDKDIPEWVLLLIVLVAGLALTEEENRDFWILVIGVAAFIKLLIEAARKDDRNS